MKTSSGHVTDGGAQRPRPDTSLRRIAECMLLSRQAADPNNIHRVTAKELGVHSTLLSGFRALQEEHPSILATVLAWPNQEQAEGLVLTFGNFKAESRGKAKTSKWYLAKRLAPEAFVRLHLSSTKALTPALCALPDAMLERASAMDVATLRDAFTCRGRNRYHARPSMFFPGTAAALDLRIIERRLELDVEFLTELATCELGDDQYGFLERWVKDSPEAARQWVRTPKWKRPLLHRCTATFSITNPGKNKPCVDAEAHEIWESFKYLRGTLMGTVDTPQLPHRRRTEHPQAVGAFFQHYAKFTFRDRPRWRDVYWTFGFMLAHGKDVGDMWTPPWPSINGVRVAHS